MAVEGGVLGQPSGRASPFRGDVEIDVPVDLLLVDERPTLSVTGRALLLRRLLAAGPPQEGQDSGEDGRADRSGPRQNQDGLQTPR
jgi:hypothetical protein